MWILLWHSGELHVPTVSSPSEADKATKQKALSPIALQILGTSPWSTKKAIKLCQSKKKKKKKQSNCASKPDAGPGELYFQNGLSSGYFHLNNNLKSV